MMKGLSKEDLRRYVIAILAVLAAFLVRVSLMPVLGDERFSFTPFVATVVFCVWYCGLRPAVLAAMLSALVVWYTFLPPQHSFGAKNSVPELAGMFVFFLLCGLIIALVESNRRARARLEKKVQERTTELSAANAALRSLTARLLRLQDEERRRLARELHDSVGQLLAAISMNIGALKKMQLSPAAVVAVSDSEDLTREASRQIRTISHLLHPPLLDELGLLPALRWSVQGFSARSGIAVRLKAPEEVGRLGDDVELAVYRMVQECLINIHRHSGSSTAEVEIALAPGALEIVVRDAGKGIPSEKSNGAAKRPGVGLRGMMERISELGGTFEVRSSEAGTVVITRLPVTNGLRTATFQAESLQQ
jgi:signal transduction histidine kinase